MQPYAEYRQWLDGECLDQDGVVVGCNQSEEWLLPWWWERYRKHNVYPVTFVDFGMSTQLKAWCQERGDFRRLLIPDCFVAEKEEMDSARLPQWKATCGEDFWHKRAAWFKKPAACLQSPYRRSIWLDLDCDVRGNVKELFAACDHPSGIALANYSKTGNLGYNAGVIVYRRGNVLIREWADQAFNRNREFGGDQDLLIAIIREEEWVIPELKPIYNWSRACGENPDAVIMHWHGDAGKMIIASELMIENLRSF